MQQRMLVPVQLVKVGRDQHLIIEPVHRVVERDSVEPDLGPGVREQRLQMCQR